MKTPVKMRSRKLRSSIPSLLLEKIGREDSNYLQRILKPQSDLDPYMGSPAYLGMTGRRGLLLYKGEYSDVLACEHPNVPGTGIIFPTAEKAGCFDIKALSASLKQRWKNLRVIRVPDEWAKYWETVLNGRMIEEDVLDYRFPVHTIDIPELLDCRGAKLYNFKKTMRKLDTGHLKIREFGESGDSFHAQKILKAWCQEDPLQSDPSLIEPACFVFDIFKENNYKLEGLIAFNESDTPVGFTIWEWPSVPQGTANAIIHCSLRVQGLSEYLHYLMAEQIGMKGIRRLCIGGSETPGLDFFKRKMKPVDSRTLWSILL